jgi:hypothetical protein
MSENNVASRALIRAALAGKVDPEYAAVLADKHAGRVQFTDTDIDVEQFEKQFETLIDELVEATPPKFREAEAQKAAAYDAAAEGQRMAAREKADHAARGLAFR